VPDELRRGIAPTLVRRTEPCDIDIQIEALHQLQKQPGFVVKKQTTKRKSNKLSSWFSALITKSRRFFGFIKMFN